MRRALIGLSSPIGFNYNRVRSKIWSSSDPDDDPIPLLDSPLGLFLLYDEIWFFNRKMCPSNCLGLEYVKILDEEVDFEKLDFIQFTCISWDLTILKLFQSNTLQKA